MCERIGVIEWIFGWFKDKHKTGAFVLYYDLFGSPSKFTVLTKWYQPKRRRFNT